MHATTLRVSDPHESRTATLLAMQVAGQTCTVRATPVWPIADVLDFDGQCDAFTATNGEIDAAMITDVLESQMIAPPRPRRRRERGVSSRAHFFAG
ncbi:MAG: hypothetical protein DWI27_01670 [Planctomycetota bacterium]|jgi:hypothetical protein|nr:MAG: hypothetical protein DWH83_07370 [Planctomycetota bacterium]RLT19849.1 MAG: hypothetical protein DWI27_01670 [Planctomycetota bacterium]